MMHLPHYFYTSCKEVKHAENLTQHVEGVMDKVREHFEGVMENVFHREGYIST